MSNCTHININNKNVNASYDLLTLHLLYEREREREHDVIIKWKGTQKGEVGRRNVLKKVALYMRFCLNTHI